MGSAAFSAQYQQQPVPADGNMVNWKWFTRYTELHLKTDGVRSIGIDPEADKVVRMSTCSAKIEDGGVLLPKDAAWMEDFKVELLAFPNGKHDDQVDALSQLINWTRKRSRYTLDNVS